MNPKEKNKLLFTETRTNIKRKLKGYIKQLTADPFGYEKKIKINVLRFFALAAKQENFSPNRLVIHLYINDNKVNSFLDSGLGTTRILLSREICQLFTGESITNAWVLLKIQKCLLKLAEDNMIAPNDLQVLLKISNCIPVLEVYDEDILIKNIPIKELVKLFHTL